VLTSWRALSTVARQTFEAKAVELSVAAKLVAECADLERKLALVESGAVRKRRAVRG
jgi:hypothetical protein